MKFISFKATNRVDEYKKMYLIDDVLGCIDRNNELVCKNLVQDLYVWFTIIYYKLICPGNDNNKNEILSNLV